MHIVCSNAITKAIPCIALPADISIPAIRISSHIVRAGKA
jgi:hypothetical protein